MSEPFNFLVLAEEFDQAKTNFEDALIAVGLGDYVELGWDPYDGSLELYRVNANRTEITEEQQRVMWLHGFVKVYVNYDDGRGEVYSFGTQNGFTASEGRLASNHNEYRYPNGK